MTSLRLFASIVSPVALSLALASCSPAARVGGEPAALAQAPQGEAPGLSATQMEVDSSYEGTFPVMLGDEMLAVKDIDVYGEGESGEVFLGDLGASAVEGVSGIIGKAGPAPKGLSASDLDISGKRYRLFVTLPDMGKRVVEAFIDNGSGKAYLAYGGLVYECDPSLGNVFESLELYGREREEPDDDAKELLAHHGWTPLFKSHTVEWKVPGDFRPYDHTSGISVYWSIAMRLSVIGGYSPDIVPGKRFEVDFVPLREPLPAGLRSKRAARAVIVRSDGEIRMAFIESLDSDLLGCSLSRKSVSEGELDALFHRPSKSPQGNSTLEKTVREFYGYISKRDLSGFAGVTSWKFKLKSYLGARKPYDDLSFDSIDMIFGDRLKAGVDGIDRISAQRLGSGTAKWSVGLSAYRYAAEDGSGKVKLPDMRFLEAQRFGNSGYLINREGVSP